MEQRALDADQNDAVRQSKAEKLAAMRVEADKAILAYRAEQAAVLDKTARLRALRLARDANVIEAAVAPLARQRERRKRDR